MSPEKIRAFFNSRTRNRPSGPQLSGLNNVYLLGFGRNEPAFVKPPLADGQQRADAVDKNIGDTAF